MYIIEVQCLISQYSDHTKAVMINIGMGGVLR